MLPLVEAGAVAIEIDATGAGEVSFGLRKPFLDPPSVMVQEVRADTGATWSITAETNTLVRISVTGSALTNATISIGWVAMSKI